MTKDKDDLYEGRLQTEVKHEILRRYIQRFSRIVGSKWKGLTYVDCFSGPWKSTSQDYKDTSFGIVLEELKSARETVKEQWNRSLDLRLFFLESDPASFEKLRMYANGIKEAEVRIENEELENVAEKIVSFVNERKDCFPFVFIDPLGWSGFGMNSIREILSLRPVEVLINFHSDFINRFFDVDSIPNRESFERLYGSSEYVDAVDETYANFPFKGAYFGKEEAAVRVYCTCLAEAGDFEYVARAIVLYGNKDRTYFNLVYATRNLKGIEAFKDAEKSAMILMEQSRVNHIIRRHAAPGQEELFDPIAYGMEETAHYAEIKSQHGREARDRVRKCMLTSRKVEYDTIWYEAMRSPLIWSKDLNDWIEEWRNNGNLEVLGLSEREKRPKLGKGHQLLWVDEIDKP